MIGWGELFRAGGAMGFTPREIREMSLWEFHMTVDGFKKAKAPPKRDGDSDEVDDPTPPSEDEFFAIMAAHGKS